MGRLNRDRGAQAGFTLIEIMIAVVVTAIGFAAIFSLQIASMQANISARETSAAVNLAERYVEVLRGETYLWTKEENVADVPGAAFLGNAQEEWHSFSPTPVDLNGRQFISDDPNNGSPLARQRFCVHYWLDQLSTPHDHLVNARVRVVWQRAAIDDKALMRDPCANPANFQESVQDWLTITVPTVLRRTGQQ